MPYLTVADLRKPPYSISEQELDDSRAEILLEVTKDMIEKECRQSFLKEGTDEAPVEKRIHGKDSYAVYLPRPIISLKKIKIYDTNGAISEYEPSAFSVKERVIEWLCQEVDESPRYRADIFILGRNNIGVVGVWGYADVPKAISYIQGKMVNMIVKTGGLAVTKSSESIGDYSYSLLSNNAKDSSFSVVTGDREIDLILERYTDVRIDNAA